MKKRILRSVLFVSLAAFGLLTVIYSFDAFGQDQKKPYVIGVLSVRGAKACRSRWQPTVDYLNENIEQAVFTMVPFNYNEFRTAIEKNMVDFILVDPPLYVDLEANKGAERIVSLENVALGSPFVRIGGTVIAKADRGDINQLQDLRRKDVAAVDRSSLGGWMAAWQEMKDRGFRSEKDFKRLEILHSNDAVVSAVLDGSVDAGIVTAGTLEAMQSEGKIHTSDLKVINHMKKDHRLRGEVDNYTHEKFPFVHSTHLYPGWVFAKMPHADLELSEEIAKALLSIEPDYLAAVKGHYYDWTIPLNYQSVHSLLKNLKVSPYERFGEISWRDVARQYRYQIEIFGVLMLLLIVAIAVVTRLNRQLASSHKELRENEQRFRDIIESMGSGVAVYEEFGDGENFVLVDINKKGQEISRVDKKDILGLSITEAFPGVRKMGLLEIMRDVWKNGSPRHYPVSLYEDAKISQWLENYVYKLASGRIVAVYNDLSEEKKSEALLRERENRYRIVAEQTGNIVYDYDLVLEKIVWAGAVEEITGFSYPDFSKITAQEWLEMVHDEDRETVISAMGKAKEMRSQYRVEYRMQRQDGTYVYVEDRGVFLTDENGQAVRMLGSMHGIGARKKREQALSQQKELLVNIMSTVPHFIFWKDRNSVFLGCNENLARVAGLEKPEDIVGKTDYDMPWKKEEADFFVQCDREVMEKGEPILDIEEPQLQADGKEAVLLTSKVPLKDPEGNVIGILGIYADITEIKNNEKLLKKIAADLEKRNQELQEAQAQILQTEKMAAVGQLSAGIAHEIKNPLSTILLSVDSIEMRVDDKDDKVASRIRMIREAAQRADKVIKELLNFSRSQNEGTETIDLHEVLNNSVSLAMNGAKLDNIDISTEFKAHPDSIINANTVLMQQVALNLLNNAIDATGSGGKIVVKTRNESSSSSSPEKVVIEFIDSGDGISDEHIGRIFDPFYTTKELGKGTGLGLSTVYTIIEKFGGSISVESTLGEGTKFTITLPLVKS